jgi:parallel beta-helix repeat protein
VQVQQHVNSEELYMRNAKLKRVCQAEIMIGSLLLTGLVSHSADAQLNRTNTQTPIAETTTPQYQKVIYVNPALGKDEPNAGHSATAPLETITYALQQAEPGTTIQLAPGSYSSESGEVFPLVIKQGVVLKGDESSLGQNIVITGGDRYISPTFRRQNVAVLAEKDSTISGVAITNPNKRGTALWIESTNPTVKHSTFANSNREGIFVTGLAAPKIEDNVFTKNGGNGISIADSAQGEIRKNVFQDTGFGLAIGGTSEPLVADNKIIQNKDGMFISEQAQPVLRNNVIENNQRDGIAIAYCSQAQLDLSGGNIFSNNGQYDINNGGANSLALNGNQIDSSRVNEQKLQCS